jgi:putative ATP-dependent endonuclease of OLD family
LIKVDSTFFLPISQLFHEERINRKCYIITDRDKDYTSSKENADSDKIGITRMKDLLLQQNNNSCIIPSFALNTFEIQFYKKNIDILKRMLDTKLIYKQEARIVEIKGNLDSDNNEDVCKAIMKCVMHVKKGWMALTLIDYCETNAIIPQIPHYIGKVFKKVVL